VAAVTDAPAPATRPHPDFVPTLTRLVEAYEDLANALAMDEDTGDEQARVEQLLDALGIDVDEDGRATMRG
jgi:hypothetical protein